MTMNKVVPNRKRKQKQTNYDLVLSPSTKIIALFPSGRKCYCEIWF